MIDSRVPAASHPGRWLCLLAITVFLLSLAAGILVPVYTDEIAWRFHERAAVDGGFDSMFNDMCGPNTIARAPWTMMPVRMFSSIANQTFADPFFIRLAGLACAFAFAGLLWLLTVQLERDPARRDWLRALAFALLALGILPYLVVLSRPEQPLILTSTAMALIVFVQPVSLDAKLLAWLKVAAIVVLADIAVSYHLKGVVFSPLAFACIAVCARGKGTLAPRLVGTIALAALVAVAAHYWVGRFQCPGDPKLAAMLGRENVTAILGGPAPFDGLLLQLLSGANPLNYVWLAVPDNDPVGFWLPPALFPQPVWLAVASGITLLWVATGFFAIRALGRFLMGEGLRAMAEPRAALALTILACVLVWGMSQVNRNAYEASLVLPLLVVCVALCLTLPDPGGSMQIRAPARLAVIAVPAALLCQAAMIGLTAGPLLKAVQTPGYLDDQPNSVSISGYADISRDIGQAMAMSGMPAGRRLKRLLVDDVTYLALQRSHMPLHRLGVLGVWSGGIADPVQYLRSRNSDGVVIGCRYLPPIMRQAASRSGQICAISRRALDRLAASPASAQSLAQ